MKKILFTLSFILLFLPAMAQNNDTWQRYFDEMVEMDDDETTNWSAVYDALSELADHPININTATKEDFEQLPFLTDAQIEEICAYVYQYGPMKSLGELAMIEPLDYYRRRLLSCFVYVGKEKEKGFPKLKNILKYGKHEVLAAAKIPMYERKGDGNGYLGYKYKHNVRYNFSYGQYVKAGIVGSQDSGEPFFANKNKWGYDYYSFYFMARNWNRIKALVVGRYRVSLGMGLVINNDFSLGKMASLSTFGRNRNALRAHSSRSDYNYLQGAAATVTMFRGLDITGFISYRSIDATLDNNTGTVTTLLTNGYHRTESELLRKHNTRQAVAGGNINYTVGAFRAGLSALGTSFNRRLEPQTTQLYRRFNPRGKHFSNFGADYGYTGPRLSINGEMAVDGTGAVATVNAVGYTMMEGLNVMALQRFYSYRYNALMGQSFSAGGAVKNENGAYVGITWTPLYAFTITGYTDYARFAWAKYRISRASYAWDNMLQAVWQTDKYTFTGRYRLKKSQRDNADKTALIDRTEHRARLSSAATWGVLTLKAQGDVSLTQSEQSSFGWMASGHATIAWQWLQAQLTAGYFNTDGYDSRIYTYERGLLYNFSYPMFYGRGMRSALFVRAQAGKQLLIIAKAASTRYFDRDKISSGLQQINGSSMTDVELQLRWKF